MTAHEVLWHLLTLGVQMTPMPDGTVRYRAGKGVLTDEVLALIRPHRQDLYLLVEDWSERAAIAEALGGLSQAEAECLAWTCLFTSHDGCAACGYPERAEV